MTSNPTDAAWLRGYRVGPQRWRRDGISARTGAAWSGFNSAVWPVRDEEDRGFVLKVSRPAWTIEPEVVALGAWDGHGAVDCHGYSRDDNAVLLQRLDGNRSLDAASVLAELHRARPPSGFRHLTVEARSLADDIRSRSRTGLPPALTQGQMEQAIDTWEGVEPAATDRLLHKDVHFLNVLAVAEGVPGWAGLDLSVRRARRDRARTRTAQSLG